MRNIFSEIASHGWWHERVTSLSRERGGYYLSHCAIDPVAPQGQVEINS